MWSEAFPNPPPSPGRRIPLTRDGNLSVTAHPQSWFVVCRSDDLPPGRVASRSLLGEAVVVFRTGQGQVATLAAHCAHMGTHLGRGCVEGETLRCPLHHWAFDVHGTCREKSVPDPLGEPNEVRVSQRVYPTVERFGVVWAFTGPRPLFPPPAFDGVQSEGVRTTLGTPVRLECPWFALAANAFDVQHLRTVHERALREPPGLERLDPYRLQFRYVSRVTGGGLANEAVRRLSQDHVHVSITGWGGTTLSVESRLGRLRSLLLLSLTPVGDGALTEVQPIFGVTRRHLPGLDWLHALGTRWLFTAFLGRDVRIMDGMRFAARLPLRDNEPLQRYLELLDELPSADAAWTQAT
ncbi:MAG TPA: Rieske 2Fe-2S domain-containing protein [Chloroflexota bacterium]